MPRGKARMSCASWPWPCCLCQHGRLRVYTPSMWPCWHTPLPRFSSQVTCQHPALVCIWLSAHLTTLPCYAQAIPLRCGRERWLQSLTTRANGTPGSPGDVSPLVVAAVAAEQHGAMTRSNLLLGLADVGCTAGQLGPVPSSAAAAMAGFVQQVKANGQAIRNTLTALGKPLRATWPLRARALRGDPPKTCKPTLTLTLKILKP